MTPGARLILVKHGKPVIAPNRPRSAWALSEQGRVAARRLAVKLDVFAPVRLLASPERKAADTADALGKALDLDVTLDEDFAEHRADEDPFLTPEAFEADLAAMFARPDALVMGEETGRAALTRFDAALRRRSLPGRETAIVVAHGRIITLWLSARLGFDPMAFWKRLGLGCAVVVGLGDYQIIEP